MKIYFLAHLGRFVDVVNIYVFFYRYSHGETSLS
jgi:hypothetical protein